jgi:hypothetical protein
MTPNNTDHDTADKIELALANWIESMEGFRKRKALQKYSRLEPLWSGVYDVTGPSATYRLGAKLHDLPAGPTVDVSCLVNLYENDGALAPAPALTRIQTVPRTPWLRNGLSPHDIERYRITSLDTARRRLRNYDRYLGRNAQGVLCLYQPVQHQRHARRVLDLDDPDFRLLQIAPAIVESRFLDWTVSLGIGDLPTISFRTDPTGMRTVFGLRDKSGNRRDALLHWVRGHFRQKRDDASDLFWVRRHMRGVQRFHWSGIRCELRPAPAEFDPEYSGYTDLAETANMERLQAGGDPVAKGVD